MRIDDVFASTATTCSFEFFPPKSATGSQRLFKVIERLEALKPSFVSVTYGAGGSTRELTHELVERIETHTELDPIPHLTCVCHQPDDIEAILRRYAEAGIANILALAGDPPKERGDWDRDQDGFRYAADLVRFIRRFGEEGRHPDRRGFGIGVAGFPEGHPATPNRLDELDHLKAKVDAGADYICTQLFFDNREFYDFRERCELAGIRVPIVAGIMPVTSTQTLRRMAELAAGTRFPAPLLRDLYRCQDDPNAIRAVGIHHATEQCRDLLHHNVQGLHFYTLNQSDATLKIYETLGLRSSTQLAGPPG